MKAKRAKFVFLSLCSGLLTGFSLNVPGWNDYLMQFGAGVFFALAILTADVVAGTQQFHSIRRKMIFLVISIIAYYSAITITMITIEVMPFALALFISGFVVRVCCL